jgi:hypothetical protein
MMTQADKTADNKGEVRPSTDKSVKLEDKIENEKDDKMADENTSDECKNGS